MARPPLPIGTHGKIRCYQRGPGWKATTNFRDCDGKTRSGGRVGRTKAEAERNLKQALAERTGPSGGSLTGESRFKEAAEQWFSAFQTAVDTGTRSPGSGQIYRSILDRHVLPGLGELRLREATVPRVDAFLDSLRRSVGVATAKTARSVISGVLGLAVRHGALTMNPTRETSRLERGRKKKGPRALTLEERTKWLMLLEADDKAVRRDLPDLSRFMMATGVRLGEALALLWDDVDLDAGTVEVNYTVIRLKGVGLVRKSTKTEAGERTLSLPSWAVNMLKRRRAATLYPTGPVFPDSLGGLRDPSNTARVIADQLGHTRPSMTQDVYLGRKTVDRAVADALEAAFAVTKSAS